jgi:hypothetical protein
LDGPFARTIGAAKKYVVSSTLDLVDWNAELVRGDLEKAVQRLKRESGKGLLVGGVKLPLAVAELGLIDEYEFVVQPRIAGHGPAFVRGAIEESRLEAREPAGVRLGGGGDAVCAEKVAIGLVSPIRLHRGGGVTLAGAESSPAPRHSGLHRLETSIDTRTLVPILQR